MSVFSHLFSGIDLFEDARVEQGPVQMATDEVLLGSIERPLLRHFRWQGSWVSFGYSQKWNDIEQAFPRRQLVRRWSGGGAVDHSEDWTFSLLVPLTHPFRRLSAAASYYEIHLCLKAALSQLFEGIQQVAKGEERLGPQCFLSPRCNDLWRNGVKVVGGAQKRTQTGLLHQGSIQNLILPSSFISVFGSHLAARTNFFVPSESIGKESVKLSEKRYGTQEWLKKT